MKALYTELAFLYSLMALHSFILFMYNDSLISYTAGICGVIAALVKFCQAWHEEKRRE